MTSQSQQHSLEKIKKYQTLLGLLPDKKYTVDELKKKYRVTALKHHPDKNFNSEESTKKFKEINEAYLYLYDIYGNYNHDVKNDNIKDKNYNHYEPGVDDNSYTHLLSKFVNSLMKKFSKTQISTLHIIIQLIMNKCAILTSTMFDRMDCESLLFLHKLILKYHNLLELGADRLNTIREIIIKKLQENDIIIIQPTISELFSENNIQVIEHEKKIYYVPLWHTELYYKLKHSRSENDNNDNREEERELIVKCIPNLPEHIYIDEINNIYIHLRTRIENLFNQTKLTVLISESVSFDIPIHTLEFKTHQTITLKKCGIPMINTENMYDISVKMNVIIHLEILI